MDPNQLSVIGRNLPVFQEDFKSMEADLTERIRSSAFLVVGGGGSIGQAVVKELFRRSPRCLHVVDSSENNLVELVRDLRSSLGYIEGDFRTLALDASAPEYKAFIESVEPYDHVLNLAAMKHVRSEKDPFTLMRMIRTNVLMTKSTVDFAVQRGTRRYFAVSSDKAVNPANAMGATKRAMELCLVAASESIEVTSARFANVAFSNGSLLYGFGLRLAKRQPLSAPQDVLRYFITAQEAAFLCLLAFLAGNNRECFFPAPGSGFQAISFRTVAEKFLTSQGFTPHPCASEEEARSRVEELSARGEWPCYFFDSDTTGEKHLEEFYSVEETVDFNRFNEVGVVSWPPTRDAAGLERFLQQVLDLQETGSWSRPDLLSPLQTLVPTFDHRDTGKFLDNRM